ncbi:hypothetical protein [Mangrovicoccus sp. HB161399]|uniref:hypothetical protein n=1 Tax=Mangrovicoccus sp. HB161399 TaxID=2720392 RepID=UPI00155592E7|nr:hypothetical protein [Mangrovicoccus sp. HB161399]
MELLIDALLEWISEETGRDTSGMPHPQIAEMTPRALTREFYADHPYLIPEDGQDERIQALYAATDGPDGRIYILAAATFDGADDFEDPYENPVWREVLLHELVHHLQWQAGEPANWACRNFGEEEAYRLGGRYLRRTRTTDPMPNRNFWAHAYSRC